MDTLTFLRADHESVLAMLQVLDGLPMAAKLRSEG